MFTNPYKFENQIKIILQKGFTPIFAHKINKAFSYKKPVILTLMMGMRIIIESFSQ
jgi:hypothetical protein